MVDGFLGGADNERVRSGLVVAACDNENEMRWGGWMG